MGETPVINLRDISIRCGRCNAYQTLTSYRPREGWNVYAFECNHDGCDPDETRTLVEIPSHLDEFARAHPDCGGDCGGGCGSGTR